MPRAYTSPSEFCALKLYCVCFKSHVHLQTVAVDGPQCMTIANSGWSHCDNSGAVAVSSHAAGKFFVEIVQFIYDTWYLHSRFNVTCTLSIGYTRVVVLAMHIRSYVSARTSLKHILQKVGSTWQTIWWNQHFPMIFRINATSLDGVSVSGYWTCLGRQSRQQIVMDSAVCEFYCLCVYTFSADERSCGGRSLATCWVTWRLPRARKSSAKACCWRSAHDIRLCDL